MQTIQVKTALGIVEGEQREGLRIFRGIPYAEPLAGLGRVRRPAPVQPWAGVKPALEWGLAAPQEEIALMGVGPKGDDCLNLNIWSPASEVPLPVMVWIHGGGFITGSSSQALYEASRLAQDNKVVVVSLNYRLGILGFGCFAAYPELEADTNNGLRDQILALTWVRDHIAGFGGDPARVTIFGESAGGMSVACLLASPAAKGLFQRAIIQSGSGDHILRPAEARRIAQVFADAAGGDVAACLQGELKGIVRAQRACTREIVQRGLHDLPVPQFGMTLLPVLGDDILPEHPEQAAAVGAARDVPLLIGTNVDEWNFFYFTPQMMGLDPEPKPDTEERLLHEFERAMPGRGEAMLRAYRYILPDANRDALVCALETDRIFRLPSTRLLEAREAAGGKSWSYLFDWPSPMRVLKSCHVIEIPFVFGITNEPTGQFFTGGGEAAATLSADVRAAWAGFAHGNDPAAPGFPAWPAYGGGYRYTMAIAARSRVVDDPEEDRRRVWEGHI
jgi:para-nitrobenzyl esterase